jgi:prephenate dehydrogenase
MNAQASPQIQSVKIVGAGLIGTSIALALAHQGVFVSIDEADHKVLALAKDLLAPYLKAEGEERREFDLVIIATPPASVVSALKAEFATNSKSIFIDVSSVKTNLIQEIDALPAFAERFVGTHPMAGREVSGASSAQADLFNGRAWIITPTTNSSPRAMAVVKELIQALGASSYEMSAQEHDHLMARISHLPQIASTLIASEIQDLGAGLELSGQGLRDMTRIAGSDGALWSEILLENKDEVLSTLDRFISSALALKGAISESKQEEIKTLFLMGNSGRAKVSGKHGAKPRNYLHLLVVIKDEPGALSQLFTECAQIKANIEDLSIEHSPGQESGLITLAFSPEDGERVEAHLKKKDWKVHRR